MSVTVWPRAAWGARPPLRTVAAAPRRRGRLWLHHTDRLPGSVGLGAAGVRWVQKYHQDNGWADIGYPFLYSPTARVVYLGHDPTRVGGHTRGDNDGAHALAVLGDYHRTPGDELPGHVVDDLAAFLRWFEAEGYGPGRFTGGHRDAPGAATACPGDRLHRLLPTINRRATEDDPMRWLNRWPGWARGLAQQLRDRGWITEDTDPNRRVGDLTLAEWLAFEDRMRR